MPLKMEFCLQGPVEDKKINKKNYKSNHTSTVYKFLMEFFCIKIAYSNTCTCSIKNILAEYHEKNEFEDRVTN